ncbi:hypothetical protein EVAR_236_1 [Eumeta japonica]|uniref:Uncharacterized protein n=1 Tax=Eumeta variegata TaxID=151549 RepID=A0A4C1S915_EUMVA|nr:hypothetical protein EVAR_236_1 [Eumeta japonica]
MISIVVSVGRSGRLNLAPLAAPASLFLSASDLIANFWNHEWNSVKDVPDLSGLNAIELFLLIQLFPLELANPGGCVVVLQTALLTNPFVSPSSNALLSLF